MGCTQSKVVQTNKQGPSQSMKAKEEPVTKTKAKEKPITKTNAKEKPHTRMKDKQEALNKIETKEEPLKQPEIKYQPLKKAEVKELSVRKVFTNFTMGKQVMNEEQLYSFIEQALELSLDDPTIGYILTTLMKLEKLEEVEFQNFEALFKHTKTNSVAKLIKKLPGVRKDAEHPDNFKKTYLKIFHYYTGTHKTLDLEVAEQLWAVYLRGKLKYMQQFEQYLKQLPDRETKKVHMDLWHMMLEFSLQGKNLQEYREEDGWHTFIDGFVNFMKNK